MSHKFKTAVNIALSTNPATGLLGDLYYDTTAGAFKYYNGSTWTGISGAKYTYSSTPPASPTAGDIWVDSGDGTEYTYVADGDSNQWVELSNAGLPGPATTGATGATGATGSSGIISVSSPIVNSGTSTSAVLSLNSAIVPYLNTANTFTVSPQQININSSTSNGLIIKAASSQTADIQQWQDSGSNVLAKVAYDGSASFANGFVAGKNKLINGDFSIWQRGGNQTASITAATAGSTSTTYTSANSFIVGQYVSVTGITPSTLNAFGQVTAASGTSFTINAGTTGTYTSGGTAAGTAFTNATASTYTADRFMTNTNVGETIKTYQMMFSEGSAPVSGYESPYYIRLNRTVVGSAVSSYFYQNIEDVRTFAGQTVTFSFWAKASASYTFSPGDMYLYQAFGTNASASVGTPINLSNVTLTTSWVRYTFTVNVPSISGKVIGLNSYLAATLSFPSTAGTFTIDTWGWQLESGSIATPFTTATGTFAGELAACQRYYFRSTPGNGAGQYGTGVTSTTTTAYCYINLPVPMRVIPTSVESNSLQVIDRVAATAYAASGIGLSDGTSTNFIELSMTIATATAGRFVALRNATSAGYLGFSAEL